MEIRNARTRTRASGPAAAHRGVLHARDERRHKLTHSLTAGPAAAHRGVLHHDQARQCQDGPHALRLLRRLPQAQLHTTHHTRARAHTHTTHTQHTHTHVFFVCYGAFRSQESHACPCVCACACACVRVRACVCVRVSLHHLPIVCSYAFQRDGGGGGWGGREGMVQRVARTRAHTHVLAFHSPPSPMPPPAHAPCGARRRIPSTAGPEERPEAWLEAGAVFSGLFAELTSNEPKRENVCR